VLLPAWRLKLTESETFRRAWLSWPRCAVFDSSYSIILHVMSNYQGFSGLFLVPDHRFFHAPDVRGPSRFRAQQDCRLFRRLLQGLLVGVGDLYGAREARLKEKKRRSATKKRRERAGPEEQASRGVGPRSISVQSGFAYRSYLPRTVSIPDRMSRIFACASLPTLSVRVALSMVTIWETFATESLGNPVSSDERETFPGAPAQSMLLVRGTHITVDILLLLRGSPCTTTTGRRKPGAEPPGSDRSAHQMSPCDTVTTIPSSTACERP